MKNTVPEGYDIALRSYKDRMFQQDIGWCQDPIQAAWLGLTEEAKKRVIKRYTAKNPIALFPVFWKSTYDWSPDQDNGGVAQIALQSMLIQYDDDKIFLCPAWPKEWDVNFKLHAPQNTTISGIVRNGKLDYVVSPQSRAKDVYSLLNK